VPRAEVTFAREKKAAATLRRAKGRNEKSSEYGRGRREGYGT